MFRVIFLLRPADPLLLRAGGGLGKLVAHTAAQNYLLLFVCLSQQGFSAPDLAGDVSIARLFRFPNASPSPRRTPSLGMWRQLVVLTSWCQG